MRVTDLLSPSGIPLCAAPAPHGGLFVFPVMHNPLGYAAAILIGSVAGMLMLGLLKKKQA